MRKVILTALFVTAGTLLMAGGNIMTSGSNDNSKKPCDTGDVYVDYEKRLMWQDAPYGDVADGAYKYNRSAGKAGRWSYAKNYCRNLTYAGYDDWRLPMIGELTNLFDKLRGLKHTIGVDFWTSTPSEGNKYWSVYAVVKGQPYEHNRGDSQYIRCVRCLEE